MRFNKLFKDSRLALMAAGWPATIEDVAAASGVSRQAVMDIEAGKLPRQIMWRRLVAAIGLSAEEFLRAMTPEEREVALSPSKRGIRNPELLSEDPPPVVPIAKEGGARFVPGALPPRWIPVYDGKADGRGFFRFESSEQEDCPPELMAVKNAYFVRVPDGSMTPMLRKGWLAGVSPVAHIAPGDLVVALHDDGTGCLRQFIDRVDGDIILASLWTYAEDRHPDDEDSSEETPKARMHKIVSIRRTKK